MLISSLGLTEASFIERNCKEFSKHNPLTNRIHIANSNQELRLFYCNYTSTWHCNDCT